MVFSFELIKHPNIRYRQSLGRLACCELQGMLEALGIQSSVVLNQFGNSDFLCFTCRELSDAELSYLAGHSSVSLMAEQVSGGLLRPLSVSGGVYLWEDLPEVLKYKGKTAVPFTRMMINMAVSLLGGHPPERSASSRPGDFSPLLIADPMCGKGTTLFCAAEKGHLALGLDTDKKAIREGADYFRKYLEYHRVRHNAARRSETFGKQAVPVWECRFNPFGSPGDQKQGRWLSFAEGDASLLPALVRKRSADVLVSDLPYGIQHAPRDGGHADSFSALLKRVLPAWFQSLRSGGVIALSYNTLTLKPASLDEALAAAGFSVVNRPPFRPLRHEVEQAVVRDVTFALKM